MELAARIARTMEKRNGTKLEPAAVLGGEQVDEGLGLPAIAGSFAEDDLAPILDHLATDGAVTGVVVADENHSAQPGTSGWGRFGA